MFNFGIKQVTRVEWVKHPEYMVFFADNTMTTYCVACHSHYPMVP